MRFYNSSSLQGNNKIKVIFFYFHIFSSSSQYIFYVCSKSLSLVDCANFISRLAKLNFPLFFQFFIFPLSHPPCFSIPPYQVKALRKNFNFNFSIILHATMREAQTFFFLLFIYLFILMYEQSERETEITGNNRNR